MKQALLTILTIVYAGIASSQHSEWPLQRGVMAFAPGSIKLDASVKQALQTLTVSMNANPTFRVVIEGSICKSVREAQLSWDRVNAVIEYMSDSVDRSRFISKYKGTSPSNFIYYRVPYDYEEGPYNPPRPYVSKQRKRV
jgi:hypothetical protein